MPIIEEIPYNPKRETIKNNILVSFSRHKKLRTALTEMMAENIVRPRKLYGSWPHGNRTTNRGSVFKITDYSYNEYIANSSVSSK